MFRLKKLVSTGLLLAAIGVFGCQQPRPKESPESSEGVGLTTEAADDSERQRPQTVGDEQISATNNFAGCPHGIAPPCDFPVWMACYPRTEIGEHYCSACADEETRCGDAASTLSNGLTSPKGLDYFGCEEYGYAVAAIQAWYGHRTEDVTWREYIESRPWYRDLSEVPYTEAARANLEELRRASKSCRNRPKSRVMRDRALVASWFETVETTGDPPVASLQIVDTRRVDFEGFAKFIHGLFNMGIHFDRRTTLRISKGGGNVKADGQHVRYDRAVTVAPSSSKAMSCVAGGENCEGYESITLYFDADDNLVAQAVTAAACPYVYVRRADGRWQKQGEILRHLRKASLEAAQTLDLHLGGPRAACKNTVHVRLSEQKDEVTYLDAVHLELEGRTLAPEACKSDSPPNFCARDGRRHRLVKGDRLELNFTVPDDQQRCSAAKLRASGYYELAP